MILKNILDGDVKYNVDEDYYIAFVNNYGEGILDWNIYKSGKYFDKYLEEKYKKLREIENCNIIGTGVDSFINDFTGEFEQWLYIMVDTDKELK